MIEPAGSSIVRDPEYEERTFVFGIEHEPKGTDGKDASSSCSSGSSEVTLRLRCYEKLPPDEALALMQGMDFTGQLVWSGSMLLARYLAYHPNTVCEKAVLELGAGAGLVGLLASALGAASVVLTDGSSVSLGLLEQNLLLNQSSRLGQVDVMELKWGPDLPEAIGQKSFDVVLAADVLYSAVAVPALFQTVAAVTKHLKVHSDIVGSKNHPVFYLSYFPHRTSRAEAIEILRLIEQQAQLYHLKKDLLLRTRKSTSNQWAPKEDHITASSENNMVSDSVNGIDFDEDGFVFSFCYDL